MFSSYRNLLNKRFWVVPRFIVLCPAFIGLGLLIRGGLSIPTEPGVLGAFVQEIKAGSVAAQLLGELKPGMTCYGHNTVAVQKPVK